MTELITQETEREIRAEIVNSLRNIVKNSQFAHEQMEAGHRLNELLKDPAFREAYHVKQSAVPPERAPSGAIAECTCADDPDHCAFSTLDK